MRVLIVAIDINFSTMSKRKCCNLLPGSRLDQAWTPLPPVRRPNSSARCTYRRNWWKNFISDNPNEWNVPINYIQPQRTDWKRNVWSVLTEDPADFRSHFDPLWILAVGDNNAEPQHCRYRRKSSVIARCVRICVRHVCFLLVFPWFP